MRRDRLDGDGATDPDEGFALVTHGSLRQRLAPGRQLTFGRGRDRDIRFGHQPADLRVPRFAGRLECRPDGVLIHNTSDTRTLTARAFPGPSFAIPPQTLVGTVPHLMLEVVVAGTDGNRFALTIDTRELRGAAPSGVALPDDQPPTVGFTRIPGLRPRERHLLLALCLPAWSGLVGADDVPSYGELEAMFRRRGVEVGARRLRHDLDALRRRLAEDFDVDGVYCADPSGPVGGKQSYLPALARWARASGNVTEEELERFDDGDLRVG